MHRLGHADREHLINALLVQQITGNLATTGVNYGPNVPGTSALAIQTIQTSYGFNTAGDGTSAGGSELDAAYGVISGGYLYLFLAGNFQDNGNYVNVFVDGGAPGQSTLAAPLTANLKNLNGSQFGSGFQATYAWTMDDYANVAYVEEYTYGGAGSLAGGYVGSVVVPGGIGSGLPHRRQLPCPCDAGPERHPYQHGDHDGSRGQLNGDAQHDDGS